MKETISVIIPFYSGAEWLDEALESVLQQEATKESMLFAAKKGHRKREDSSFMIE